MQGTLQRPRRQRGTRKRTHCLSPKRAENQVSENSAHEQVIVTLSTSAVIGACSCCGRMEDTTWKGQSHVHKVEEEQRSERL